MAGETLTMEQKLAQLRAQYAIKIHERLDNLAGVLGDLAESEGNVRRDLLGKVRDTTHKLAGSGATFGFPDVTTVARKMEQMCTSVLDGQVEDGENVDQELSKSCNDLCTAAEIQGLQSQKTSSDVPRASVPYLHGSSRLSILIIMEYDESTATQIHLEMEHFGFVVRIIDHPSKLMDDIKNNGPVNAIITGLLFDGDDDIALSTLAKFREIEENKDTLIVVHTVLDTMVSRLGAVRVGAKAYLVKPIDMADLVDVLDRITLRHEEDPFRVLVIDDDESLARHTEVVLQSAGMNTEVVINPMDLFTTLDDFSPELILLDLYMPGCDGQEIAAIIRQRQEYAGIPIVFLSGESDKDKQLLAMELGGDDFLTKPIRASHLISSVRIRASRFRELRSFMVRDSMTGLFNHTTTKQMLDNEIARVLRSQSKMALATLDIDHFKNVNDSYGHAVGDRVIKALARLLRQRLRSADVIGRMGGEEFAAILPDTGLAEAETVFNQIRQAFSEIVFHTDGNAFNVTLSCGVASFSDYNTATDLSDAADKALYKAKSCGRNQVVSQN
ncbi:MAG: diguanylate cyclase [Magnetovibrio sp.]|nr:diguanylate cyclase [Magnetovibrio sp.]